MKFTGRKDFSQVYLAIWLLKLKIKDMRSSVRCKNDSTLVVNGLARGTGQVNNSSGGNHVGITSEHKNNSRRKERSKELSDIFESPGPLHDIVVCWIDQHEVQNGEGFKRLQLLIIELTRCGIFYPQAYVRQLIVSGIMDSNGPMVDMDRRKRHYKILKQLPGSYIRDALEEAQIPEVTLLKAMPVYSNERRLLLHGLIDHHKNSNNTNSLSQKQKQCPSSVGDGSSPASVDQWRSLQSSSSQSGKNFSRVDLEELKAAISLLLQLPNSSSTLTDTEIDESQGSVKRPVGLTGNKPDLGEVTSGCEECRRSKRQKLSEERSSYLLGHSLNLLDDEETWWVRKGSKSLEALKTDPPPKPAKQSSRGRQKVVRKTQSLAQLAAARIEGSQGASTSHVCDNRVSCPHHRTGHDGEIPKLMDGIGASNCGDIVSVGKVLKQLRFVEKRVITVWLVTLVRQLVEDTERAAASVGQYGRSFSSVDDKGSKGWKLGEDELSSILYLMDVSNDLVSAARFLLWLLPKVLTGANSTIHGGRNSLMMPRIVGSHACDVGEAFLLSSIRRYENILVATDLLPETLSAMMHRATAVMAASNGRISGSAALTYARYLLKKYGTVASVFEWEKKNKAKFDKRLIPELESGRSPDGDSGFPLGVPAGVEDLDEYLRQKISVVRVSRVGVTMKEIVQRHVEDAFQYFYGKERKLYAGGPIKGSCLEKWDDGYQMAQKIVGGLIECMRQTGGAAQEGDPSLVSSAVSAIVYSVGLVIAKIPDLTSSGSHQNFPSTTGSMNFARRVLRFHVTCLCLLKEVLGERQRRVFEIALATEASSALAQFAAGKASRSQSQLSPEAHDSGANLSNEILNSSTKTVLGRAAKTTAAVTALVVGAILHGVASLERMVTVFRLKEGLDVIRFVRSARSNANGNARSAGAGKVDNLVEVSVHWFRVLVGNCRTVSDGLILELLGEASVVALSRMQQMLPLSLVFPPAYSIFAFVIWRPFIFNAGVVTREDIHQLYQSLVLAITDAIKHLPFRDVCLRDTRGFYDLVVADATDSEFAAMLELNGPDMHLKTLAFVPLRARLFLNAIIDCKMPYSMLTQDDGNRASGHGESGGQHAENEKLLDKLVHVLDTLQPAKFHWQWVELRLLLNEQALIEKLESHNTSLAEAIRLVSTNPDKAAGLENEKKFIEIILARLPVRPDAASLFSEVVHLFGGSLEDSVLLHVKWFLGGQDVLLGRKSIRQRLINIAESKGLSTKAQFRKPWGWCYSNLDLVRNKGDKRKFEANSLEEGEVVEEGTDLKTSVRGSTQVLDVENVYQQYVTERALIELVIPCIDQSSDDSRNTFASDLINQMNNIEQQINAVIRGQSKQRGAVNSGIEGTGNKSNNRKGMKGSNPGLARRSTGTADTVPPSPAALRASMSLRLQFLLRLLPIICADGDPSVRNMRHMLASVILRLLGSRVVHVDVDQSSPALNSYLKRDVDLSMEAFAASALDLSGESLFDRLLLVLHGLLSSCWPSWLKPRHGLKSTIERLKGFSVFDREVAEGLQNDLNRMQLPDSIRWRIQAAMPILFPSLRFSISCQPPSVSSTALAPLQPSIVVSGSHPGNSNLPPRNPVSLARSGTNAVGKTKPSPSPSQQQDVDTEIDPWTLLEDGAGSGPSSINAVGIGSSDNAYLKASSWLKGAVRVRRTDLTYIGAVDDDS